MKQLATFVWSMSIPVPEGFDPENRDHVERALIDAWDRLRPCDGELTDGELTDGQDSFEEEA